MKCKHCKKDILYALSGLRAFCSEACRKEYRRAYKANHERQRRTAYERVDKKGGYDNTYPADVDKSEPLSKPLYEDENRGHGLFEPSEQKNASKALKIDYDSFGGKDWYELAKAQCCNFEVRAKEGYCITLYEPYYLFKAKCSDCHLFKP